LLPVEHQSCPISLLLTHYIFVLSFCVAIHVIQNFSTFLYIVHLHNTVDAGYFLQNFWWHLFCDTYFAKVLQMNILCSTEYISQAHWDYLHSMTNKRWLSSCSLAQILAVMTQLLCQLVRICKLRPYVPKLGDAINLTLCIVVVWNLCENNVYFMHTDKNIYFQLLLFPS
jgi:hypothetical protein